jgi:hypothetical protein
MTSKLLVGGYTGEPCSGPPRIKCLKTHFEKSCFFKWEINRNANENGKFVRHQERRVPIVRNRGGLGGG